MKRLVPLLITFVAILAGSVLAEDTDTETYLAIGADKDLGHGIEVFADGQVKHRGFFEDEYFRKIEVGAEYALSRRVTLRGSLKGVDLVGPSGWHLYYVPGMGASFKWRPSRFEVDFRNILEVWNIVDEKPTELRLKQRVRVASPLVLNDMKIKPYLSEEYLSALNSNDHLIWNRVTAGNSFYLGKHITLDAFYIWQKKNGSLEWQNAHVLGSKVNFSF